MVEGKDSRLDTRKADSINIQDPQQRSRSLRSRQNRKKNEWRPVSGGFVVPSESQINAPVVGERDESSRKLNVSDGEEEIVWSGREKLPEVSQGLGMKNVAFHENFRGTISKNTSPRGGSRRAPVPCKVPASVPVPGSSFTMPLAISSCAENRDGFEEGNLVLQSRGFKETQGPHQHRPLHHDSRTRTRNEKKGSGEWHPQSQIPHFASTNEFLGLPSVPCYPDREAAPELVDPIFVRAPFYDYCRGQYAPSFVPLGAHPTGLEKDWRPLSGCPIASQEFSHDNFLVSSQQQCSRSNGFGRGKKDQANMNIRKRKGKGRGNRNSKREDSVMVTIVEEGSRRGAGAESKKSNPPQVQGQGRRNWKPSQEASKDVFVSQPFSPNHNRPQTIKVGATEVASIAVVNNGTERVTLSAVRLLSSSPKSSFRLSLAPLLRALSSSEKNVPVIDTTKLALNSQSLVRPGRPWLIGPGLHITFELACTASTLGLHKAVLLFNVGTQKIVRYITLICEDDIAKALAPIEPYVRLPRPRVRSFYKFVPGIPPPLPLFKKRLGIYPIPPNVKEAILTKETLPVFSEGLRKENYFEYFSTLMFAEELQMEVRP